MTGQPPVVVGEREWDGSLWWSVLASGGLHLVAIAVILLVPRSFSPPPPPLVSYSVDLVAPDRLGGTNMVAGGKGRVQGPPLTTSAPPAPKPAPPPEPPVEVASKPEPPPAPPKVEDVPKPEPKPQPKPEPKVEAKLQPHEKVEPNEMALAEKTKRVPTPPPTVAKPAPSPQAKPAPTAPAKAAPSVKAVAQVPPAKATQVVAQATPARPATPAGKSGAQQVAKATPGAATDVAARERDARIAAAVRRVEQQTGVRGGGTGQGPGEQPGGPLSVGPGEGVGGALRGFEYLMYYNQLQTRIKQSWAWAGVGPKLEAEVRLNIAENGSISNVRTVRSSGDAGFDASVERAVRAVNPLPPPPEAYRKEFADVVLTFSSEQLLQ